MTAADITVAVVLALVFAAIFGAVFDCAPLLAKTMVRRAARWWHSELDSPETLAEEWQALLDARPVGTLKLLTALGFLTKASLRHGGFVARPIGGRCGRMVRTLAGADERVINHDPGLRRVYLALGLMMLCSSAMSTVSMAYSLTIIGSVATVWIVTVALALGLFMLCLDRWLLSSRPLVRTPRGIGYYLAFAPRIAIACIYGLVMSEPVLLRLFRAEIDQRLPHTGSGQAGFIQRLDAFSTASAASDSLTVCAWELRILATLLYALPFIVSMIWSLRSRVRANGA